MLKELTQDRGEGRLCLGYSFAGEIGDSRFRLIR